jgi:TonB family protein
MPDGIQRTARTKMVLPLRVWLHEPAGESVPAQWAHTIEISHIGCRLGGLRTELSPGQVITLQRGQQKAIFRVVWSTQLAEHEYQAGIEALDHEKNIWAVDLPPSSFVPVPEKQEPARSAAAKFVPVAADRRTRWGFGFLLFVLALGLSVYYAIFHESGRAAIQPPIPTVPTAEELARLTPKPRLALFPLTRILDASASRLQIAEAPTGHIVYPVAPDESLSGKVRLQITIAANGLVKQIHALSGKQQLALAAAQAVRFWHYSSIQNNDQATERETTVTVSFLGSDAVFLEFPSANAQSAAAAIKQE